MSTDAHLSRIMHTHLGQGTTAGAN